MMLGHECVGQTVEYSSASVYNTRSTHTVFLTSAPNMAEMYRGLNYPKKKIQNSSRMGETSFQFKGIAHIDKKTKQKREMSNESALSA